MKLQFLAIATMATLVYSACAMSAPQFCATNEQRNRVAEFYKRRPGTLPVIAARELGMVDAVVASALGREQAASAPGVAFSDVWAAMSAWRQANFLIMKDENVFEVLSGVAPGTPSKTSQYFNIEYREPLRGHLRPDRYASIYAIAIPADEDVTIRGVMFFNMKGTLVFGAFVSGESLTATAEDVEKFDTVMTLVRSHDDVCSQQPSE